MLDFLSSPRSILIVEDKISFALQLASYLEQQGHTVACYEGVSACDANNFVGLNLLSLTSPQELELAKVECAFLDHYFAGRSFDGTSLCRLLAPNGIRVIGMSSVDHANQSMMRAGAVLAMRKDLIMNWLRAK